jgi:hypothetical protein
MPLPNQTKPAKKRYVPPTYEAHSIPEICRHLRDRFSKPIELCASKSKALESDTFGLTGPILMLDDFSGDFDLVKENLTVRGLNCLPVAHSESGQTLQVLFKTQLTLSLTETAQELSALDSDLGTQREREEHLVTGVVATTNLRLIEQFGTTDNWRVYGKVDSDLLVRAIQSLYDLWIFSMDRPQSGRSSVVKIY